MKKKMQGILYLLEMALMMSVIVSVYSLVDTNAIAGGFNQLVANVVNPSIFQ